MDKLFGKLRRKSMAETTSTEFVKAVCDHFNEEKNTDFATLAERDLCPFCVPISQSVTMWFEENPQMSFDKASLQVGVAKPDPSGPYSLVVGVRIHQNPPALAAAEQATSNDGGGAQSPGDANPLENPGHSGDGEVIEAGVDRDPHSAPKRTYRDIFLELYTTDAMQESGASPCKAICHGRHYSSSIFSEESVELIGSWLRYCDVTHRSYVKSKKSVLPTRVINVGHADQEPFLYLSSKVEKGEYVTLSHRWGPPEKMVKTERANLSEHLKGVPLDFLPLTFRHAVELTRLLRYRYLWIDSLCIIQDDEEDWAREAARMGSIYENCVLTISVQQGADPEAGFSWNPELLFKTSVTRIKKNGESYAVWCREVEPPFAHRNWLWLDSATDKDILFTRGWTFQENLMSTRLLLLTKRQWIWYCNGMFHEAKNGTGAAMHDGLKQWMSAYINPGGLGLTARNFKNIAKWSKQSTPSIFTPSAPGMAGNPVLNYAISSYSSMLANPMVSNPTSGRWSHIWEILHLEMWANMVASYSQRQLTKPEDKLVALSALAQSFSKRIKLPYIAGLWLEHRCMSTQLAWDIVKPKQGCGKDFGASVPCVGDCCFPRKFRAPSWSWASVDLEVDGQADNVFTPCNLFTVLDANCKIGLDPFGKVTDGYLVARVNIGPLSQVCSNVKWDKGKAQYSIDWAGKGNYTKIFYGAQISCDVDESNIADRLYFMPIATTDSYYSAIPHRSSMSIMSSIYQTGEDLPKGFEISRFLVCTEIAARGGLRTFRRIGIFKVRHETPLSFLFPEKLEDERIMLL